MTKRKIILASMSPRRKNIMRQVFENNFEVIPSNYDENRTDRNLGAIEYALKNAKGKGLDVAKNYPDAIIISADTFVIKDDRILEKPIDKEEARSMLNDISDNHIKVISGLFVIDTKTNKSYNEYEITSVKIKKLTEKNIQDYIDSGEPMDKSGAFGIQDKGGIFIESINGCYFNVPGLPLYKLNCILEKLGINVFEY